eukprot:TRINITY_DN2910_c0_g2_i1.p2 TRINITY_DN2910_c0_g2~~TRINITY_DN2910_c0_g2_i1.p2  ORF type:complete len:658 (+),score=-3.35 TRINITY_DN2910_c0_g2_i1:169-2142(+)
MAPRIDIPRRLGRNFIAVSLVGLLSLALVAQASSANGVGSCAAETRDVCGAPAGDATASHAPQQRSVVSSLLGYFATTAWILAGLAVITAATITSLLMFVVRSCTVSAHDKKWTPTPRSAAPPVSDGDSSLAVVAASPPFMSFHTVAQSRVKIAIRDAVLKAMPVAVRSFNAVGRAMNGPNGRVPWLKPLHWVFPTEVEAMLRWATWYTGLSDFGDTFFMTGLSLLVKDMDENANLTHFGRMSIWLDIQRVLQGRLQLIDIRKRFPEIEDERIQSPTVILGMPRTGTTLLFNLLSLDAESFRVPLSWECHYMYPPPEKATYHCDPRIAAMDDSFALLDAMVPDFKHIHPMYAAGPQETFELMGHDLTTFVLPFTHLHAPNYLEWFMHADITPTYEFLRWQLKYLQWRGPKARQWLLKSPEHLFSVRSLLKVFPDARLIFTHRDPLKVVSSAHSLMRSFRTITSDDVRNDQISPLWAPHLARALDDMIALREESTVTVVSSDDEDTDEDEDGASSTTSSSGASGASDGGLATGAAADADGCLLTDDRRSGSAGGCSTRSAGCSGDAKAVWDSSLAADVMYYEFVKDPVGRIRQLYAHFGEELSPQAEARMRAYLDEDRKGRRSHKHQYSWADTCLDEQEQRQRFAHYVRHFNVPREEC